MASENEELNLFVKPAQQMEPEKMASENEELNLFAKAVQCEVCEHQYNDPRVLPCGHSYCKDCVETLLCFQPTGIATVQCVHKCTELYSIGCDETTDRLPKSHSLLKIIANLPKQSVVKPSYDLAPQCCHDSTRMKLHYFCGGCCSRLCEQCVIGHICIKKKLVLLKQLEHSEHVQAVCINHCSKVTHICKQCDSDLICVYCVNRKHKGHDTQTILEHANTFRQKFMIEVHKLQNKPMPSSTEDITHLEEFEKELQHELQARKMRVLAHCVQKVNGEEKIIMEKYRKAKKQFVTEFDEGKSPSENLRRYLDNVKSLEDFEIQNDYLEEKFNDLLQIDCLMMLLSNSTENSLGSLKIDIFQAGYSTCQRISTEIEEEVHKEEQLQVDSELLKSFLQNDILPSFQERNKRSQGIQQSQSAEITEIVQLNRCESVEEDMILPVDDTEKDINCSTEVTLKTAANPWKRLICRREYLYPEQDIELLEIERNVRSILNKLTPQKFKTLMDTMLQLKIDTVKKLEKAIDLIFEKSVSEPGFSVAYANMCRVLTDSVTFRTPLKGDERQTDGKGQVTFRKILLNKCQKEFEKECPDEKLLEQNRSKKFATEEERKAWKEELDHREMMNRKRMLGHIRFIGELFKFKMISENIMHDCILKLLRAEKQDSLEDQLECLCKLLSTIGKDLDYPKAKPRMDQYFSHINQIVEKKKISSHIKFLLQDVIDLRSGGWVPRRDDGNPKTINQIHREAQQKEKQEEIARQQDKLQRSNRGGDRRDRDRGDRDRHRDRDRDRGRDSPAVRGGASTSSYGWTNVASKTGRQIAPAAVDASKFKLTKITVTDPEGCFFGEKLLKNILALTSKIRKKQKGMKGCRRMPEAFEN